MTSAQLSMHGRYGSLPLPEENNFPKGKESPLDALLAAYAVWKQVAMHMSVDTNRYELQEGNYQEAVKLLTPHRSALEAATQEMFDTLSKAAASSPANAGVFATAAFNLSPLKKLTDNYGLEGIGYRLGEGKTLVVNNPQLLKRVGNYAAGDIALLGDADEFAPYAQGGVQISWGRTISFEFCSKGGVKVNCSHASYFGEFVQDCFLISYSPVDMPALQAMYVVLLKGDPLVKNDSEHFRYYSERVRAGPGGKISPPRTVRLKKLWQDHNKRGEIRQILKSIEGVEAVKGMRDRPLEALALVRQYDWNRLKKNLQGLVSTSGSA